MQVMHLFSILSSQLADPLSVPGTPRITQAHGHTVAQWRHGSHTLVLISQQSPEKVQALIG
jgi:hypothetical protein